MYVIYGFQVDYKHPSKNGSEDHIHDNEIIDNILSSYKEYGII